MSTGHYPDGGNVWLKMGSPVAYLALIGDFEEESGTAEVDDYFVAGLNTVAMHNLYKQLYAPKLGFKFHGPKGELMNGNRVLSMFNAQQSSAQRPAFRRFAAPRQ